MTKAINPPKPNGSKLNPGTVRVTFKTHGNNGKSCLKMKVLRQLFCDQVFWKAELLGVRDITTLNQIFNFVFQFLCIPNIVIPIGVATSHKI